ncbi:MAG: LysR family transcriptional regulator [Micromonosporaceae bacterium]|nr:LysR family transcriptional regulator [Micromonosporaceae bacterium]
MSERTEPVDPRRLLIFREVARCGSLSGAASALGWTQPAVGQHLQRLERDLGVPLALRSTRGVALTEAGRCLLEHADAVASRLAVAADQMRALRTLRAGTLRVVAFPSASATLIPPALAALAGQAPGLDVRLSEQEPPEARQSVLAGDADLALLFQYPGDRAEDQHQDLTSARLLDDPIYAVLPAGQAGRMREPVDLARLGGKRWVAGCPRCRAHLVTLATAAGFHPDIRHSTDDYVVVQNLVASGFAVALLPGLALAAVPNGRVRALAVRGRPVRRISVVCRREAGESPPVRAFIQALTSTVESQRA